MASSASDAAASPALTSDQLLLRLLDLLKGTTAVQQLTREGVSQAMQVPAQLFAPGHFGYGGTLTPQWGYALEIKKAGTAEARLDLNFIDTTDARNAHAEAICQVDFAQFASALQAAGFKRETVRGEHGRVIYARFDRPDLSVKVDTVPAGTPAPGEPARACVRLVTVQ